MKLSSNTMDQWVLSVAQSLVQFVHKEMEAYRLYTVVPRLVKFIEYLTNWYVRSNRKRIKGELGGEDCQQALQTLFSVVLTMTKLMGPFTPFLTEHMYQNLKPYIQHDQDVVDGHNASVHYIMIPKTREEFINKDIERAVASMQAVIELGRVVRERNTLPLKYPLPEVVLIHKDQQVLDDVSSLQNYVTEELNVRKVTVSSDRDKYGIHLRAEPDNQVLGRRLKGDFKKVFQAVRGLTDEQLKTYIETGEIVVEGHVLSGTDLKIMYTTDRSTQSSSNYEANSDNSLLILLDITPDQSMLDEGIAREVVNRIQKLRKKARLQPSDDVTVVYEVVGNGANPGGVPEAVKKLNTVITGHSEYILEAIKQPVVPFPPPSGLDEIIHEDMEVKGALLRLWIVKGHQTAGESNPNPSPVCRFVNVQLCGVAPGSGIKGSHATVLLENPRGEYLLSRDQLLQQVKVVFGMQGRKLALSLSQSCDSELNNVDVQKLSGSTLYAYIKTK